MKLFRLFRPLPSCCIFAANHIVLNVHCKVILSPYMDCSISGNSYVV